MRKEPNDYDAMMLLVSTMQHLLFRQHAYDRISPKPNLERDRVQRLANRWESLKTLFGLYEWRYALLPIGIRRCAQWCWHGNEATVVVTHQLHVFGIRVARWIVRVEKQRLVAPMPAARLKLRPGHRHQ